MTSSARSHPAIRQIFAAPNFFETDPHPAAFQAQIYRECTCGSAIDPALFDAAVTVLPELAVDPYSHEHLGWPIHDALGWQPPSRNWQHRRLHRFQAGAAFLQESGEVWQVKPCNPRLDDRGKIVKYETRRGAGSRAYLPPIPPEIRDAIAQRYRVPVPAGGSFWGWLAYVIQNYNMRFALNMGNVFPKVVRPSCILILDSNSKKKDNPVQVLDLSSLEKQTSKFSLFKSSNSFSFQEFNQDDMLKISGMLIVTSNLNGYYLLSRINERGYPRLIDLVDEDGIQRGVSPDLKEAFIVSSKIAEDKALEKEKLRRVVSEGRHIKKYRIEYPDLNVIYTSRDDDFDALPNICSYIDEFRDQITCKEVIKGKHPIYALHRPRKEAIF